MGRGRKKQTKTEKPSRKKAFAMNNPQICTLTIVKSPLWKSSLIILDWKPLSLLWTPPALTFSKIHLVADFHGSPVVKTLCFQCMGHSIPGQGTKIPLKWGMVRKKKYLTRIFGHNIRRAGRLALYEYREVMWFEELKKNAPPTLLPHNVHASISLICLTHSDAPNSTSRALFF